MKEDINKQRPEKGRLAMDCPYGIGLLIFIHCRAQPLDDYGPESDLRGEIIHQLLEFGLIEVERSNGCGYRTTQRGRAHINQMCRLPFPEQVVMTHWVEPGSGRKIDV